jgi:hypothetical protein
MKKGKILHTKNATLIGDRNIGHTKESALCEYKHNSIDANAKNYKEDYDRINHKIMIYDDGNGMSKSEIEDFFNVGHQEGISNSIGGYGFGAYYGGCYLGQKIVVRTKKAGDKKFTEAIWQPDSNPNSPEDYLFESYTCLPQDINRSYTKIDIYIVDVNHDRYNIIGWKEFMKSDSPSFEKYFRNMEIRFRELIKSGFNMEIDGRRLESNKDPLYLNNPDVILWPGNGTFNIKLEGQDVPIEFTGVSLENVKETIPDFDSQKGGRKQDCQGLYVELCPQSISGGVLLTLGESNWGEVVEKNPNKTHARLKIKIDERAKQFFGISTIKNKPNIKFDAHSEDPNVQLMVSKIKEFLSWIDRRYKSKPKRVKKVRINNTQNPVISQIATQIKNLDINSIQPLEAMNILNEIKTKLVSID